MADGNNLPGSDGADGQDVCSFFATVFNQRQSMERLLNWLRESQTTCTDTNCFDDLNQGFPGLAERGSVEENNFMPTNNLNQNTSEMAASDALNLVLWLVVGLLTLYAMTIQRDRRRPRQDEASLKSSSSSPANNDDHDNHRRRRDGHEDDHSRPAL